MNLQELKAKATAAELTLIERVEKLVHQEAVETVAKEAIKFFESNRFDPYASADPRYPMAPYFRKLAEHLCSLKP